MTTFKVGRHADGRTFVIAYGGHRNIRWYQGAEAEAIANQVAPRPARSAAVDGRQPDASSVSAAAHLAAGLGNAASGVAGVIHAVGAVAGVWEQRQARIALEHAANVGTRLDLTYRLLDRWISAHADMDGIDLDLSGYLAREALGLASASAQKDDGPVVPQSLLYDFSKLRDVIAETRIMCATHFSELQRAGVTHLASPVTDGAPLSINFEWLISLGESPDVEWERAVSAKNVRPFEATLSLSGRPREEVVARLFNVKDAAKADGLTAAFAQANVRLVASAAAALALPGVGGPTALAIAAYGRWREMKDSTSKEAVRELILYAADVARVRLLSEAWSILDQCARSTHACSLLPIEIDGRPQVAFLDSFGRAEIATLANASMARNPPRLSKDGLHLLPAGGAVLATLE